MTGALANDDLEFALALAARAGRLLVERYELRCPLTADHHPQTGATHGRTAGENAAVPGHTEDRYP